MIETDAVRNEFQGLWKKSDHYATEPFLWHIFQSHDGWTTLLNDQQCRVKNIGRLKI